MALELHTVEAIPGAAPGRNDKLQIGVLNSVAYGAGGGAGQAVTQTISGLQLPPTYNVHLGFAADVTGYVSGKTQTGFTVNILPRLATNTVAAGTVDITIVA